MNERKQLVSTDSVLEEMRADRSSLVEPQRQIAQNTPTSNHGKENQLTLPVPCILEILARQDRGTRGVHRVGGVLDR